MWKAVRGRIALESALREMKSCRFLFTAHPVRASLPSPRMSTYEVPHRWHPRNLIPFGLGGEKPQHFRDMLKVVWKNRDNLRYAWKVLTKGVCDGCALGVAGLHDWTIDGVHLCMTRLNLLRLNTMPALDVRKLADVSRLAQLTNAELRELGRLPYPMLREKGDEGFRRITWEAAYERLARRLRGADPRRFAFFVTARGVTNEVYYMAQKVARFLGTNNVDNAARLCHSPSGAAMKSALGVSASTCRYKDWYGTDLIVFFGSNPANDQPVSTKYLHEAKKLGTQGGAGESAARARHEKVLGALAARAARSSAPRSRTIGSR